MTRRFSFIKLPCYKPFLKHLYLFAVFVPIILVSQTVNELNIGDSVLLNSVFEKAIQKKYNQPQKAIAVYDSLLKVPEIDKYPILKWDIKLAKGEALTYAGDLPQAQNLFKALTQLEANGKAEQNRLGKSYFWLGKAYHLNSYIEKATLQYLHALEIFEAIGEDRKILVKALNNIAVVKQGIKQYDQARLYLTKVVEYSKDDPDKTNYYYAKSNLCFCDRNDAIQNPSLQAYQKAYDCMINVLDELKTLEDYEREEFLIVRGSLIGYLAFYLNEQRYPRIKKEFEDFYAYFKNKDLKYFYVIARFFSGYAKLNLYEKDFAQAKRNLEKSDSVAQKFNLRDRDVLTEVKLDYLKEKGLYSQAYKQLGEYRLFKDSVSSRELKQRIDELDELYKEEKNQSNVNLKRIEIESLEKERLKSARKTRFIFFIGIVCIVLFIMIPLFQRNKKRVLYFESEITQTQEAIKRVESLIEGESHEKSRLSKRLSTDLKPNLKGVERNLSMVRNVVNDKSDLLDVQESIEVVRGTKDKVDLLINNLIAGSSKQDTIVHYAKKLVVENRKLFTGQIIFQYYGSPVNFGPKYNATLFQIINEPLKNAVFNSNARLIELFIFFHSNKLVIQINDNGFNESVSKQIGFALSNTISRVEVLGGSHEIRSSRSGTTINFEFNYQLFSLDP